MDADVVPGSVTVWTVTREDQRRITWALVRLRLRTWAYWALGLGVPVLVTGSFWFSMRDPYGGSVGDAFDLWMTAIMGAAFMALTMTLPLWTLPRLVKREYPVGVTLTAWATKTGLGVRTLRRLTFYPWSRLTQVEVGPVFVRCRQEVPRTLAVPVYLPVGPDEPARSVDFPVQLIGPEIRRELSMGIAGEHAEQPMAGNPIVIDRSLRRRLVRAWLRAQFGIVFWVLPAVFGLNVALHLATGSYRAAAFWTLMTLLNPLLWLLSGEGRMSRMYPVGTTVGGSAGEWLEIQGSWGSVAWPRGWLKQRRMTAYTVTYEMVQVGANGKPAQLTDGEKRIVVIPRAFLDTPTPAATAEV